MRRRGSRSQRSARACHGKAEQLGLTIVDEYVEPGRSALEMAKRAAFQRMLARIRNTCDIDHLIVYKLSRLARNRVDDALVMADLRRLPIITAGYRRLASNNHSVAALVEDLSYRSLQVAAAAGLVERHADVAGP
jgi:Resolvase, N terminal domain